MTLRTILRTIFSRLLLLLVMLMWLPIFLIIFCMPKAWLHDSKIFYKLADWFYRIVIRISFLPITFVGKHNIPNEPVIFAANHQSSFDIPLIGVLAKGIPHMWLAKEELMASPILRFVLPRLAILVDMSSPLKGMRSLIKAVRWVNGQNRHLMIFPEGARFTDGKVHDFYGGFAILSKKSGLPVVPVRIIGIEKVYPPDSFWVRYHPVTVVIGKPMRPQEDESDDAFKNRVHTWFIEQSED